MSYTSAFMPGPLPTTHDSGTTQWPISFSLHGSQEQPVGGWQSVSQPQTPRSARSVSGHRDRSRDRRDRSPRRSDESDQGPSQGWGPRIISLEQKVADLELQIKTADVAITGKFDASEARKAAIEGRLNSMDAVLQQRLATIEQRQTGFVNNINALAAALGSKVEQIEQLLLAQAVGPQTPPTMPVPQIPQSFGGQSASTTQHFGIGSPLSAAPTPPGLQPTTPDPWADYTAGRSPTIQQQAPQPSPVQVGAQRLSVKAWDVKEWSIAHLKVSKELKPFMGTDATYRTWAGRVRDHFKEVNADWGLVFSEIEKQKIPIPMSAQTLTYLFTTERQVQVDFAWISNVLWTFMGKNVSDTLYGNRSAMASGPDNGIELWRAYFVKHEGGADQVELGGIDSFHTFPQCTKVEELGFWIGKWIEVKEQYGKGMSDVHLRSRFLNMLPESVKKEVRETKGLDTLQLMINHVQGDLGRLNDHKLSKLHADRLKQSLGQATRVHAIMEGEQPDAVGPKQDEHLQYQTLINALSSKIDTIAAAMNQPRNQSTKNRQQQQRVRGPSDYSKFKGCLHCGGDHRVADCRTKKALLAKHDGKLPAGFKSAFDKWKAAQPAKVAALTDAELQASDLEDEDDMVWAVPCSVISSHPICPPCNFHHPNSFADIFDQDNYNDDDDEEEMVKALQEIATVKMGPKISQKQRALQQQKKPINKKTVASIAKKVRDGHYNLPDLKLDSNKGYTASWALVDSGAGRSCAKRKGHFGNARSTLRPSSVKMATANGEELKSRGCFNIQLMTQEGHVINQTFEDTDVDMPIIAVTELAANGLHGSDVIFRQHDGSIVDLEKKATSQFVRRKGVYFIKIYTPNDNNSGFTRQGAA